MESLKDTLKRNLRKEAAAQAIINFCHSERVFNFHLSKNKCKIQNKWKQSIPYGYTS